jgi:uncharacterized protein
VSTTADQTVPDGAVRGRRRRFRSLRGWLILLLCLALLAAGSLAAFGLYYSNQLLQVSHRPAGYGLKVTAATHTAATRTRGAASTVTLPRNRDTERPGVYGLSWRGGWAVVTGVIATTASTVTRRLQGSPPPPGTATRLETAVWLSDPQHARGLRYTDVRFASPLGAMPAWYVPGTAYTWVVAVHGRGSNRLDQLRILPTLHRLGLPVLAISYRNDVGAPAERDQLYHLGDREWRDVEVAVAYALLHGARQVVLYGWSMGGALVTAFLQRSPLASRVPAVVLDAPVLDWRATLALQGAKRGLPLPLTWTAEEVVHERIGIRWGDFDLDDTPSRLRVPTLLFHGEQDTTVPIQPARHLAAESAGVTFVAVPRAGHTQGWNVDPTRYERRVASFLRPYVR